MIDNGVTKIPIQFMIFFCTTLNFESSVQRVHAKSRGQSLKFILQFYANSDIILWAIITSNISRFRSLQLPCVGDSEKPTVCEQFIFFPRMKDYIQKES